MIKRIKMILKPDPKKLPPEHNNYKGVEFKNEALVFTKTQILEDCSFHHCALIFSKKASVKMNNVTISHSVLSGHLVGSDWKIVTLTGAILNDVHVSHAKWVGTHFVASKGRLTLTSTDQVHTSFVSSPDLEVYAKNLSSKHPTRSTWETQRDSTLKELSVEEIRELTRDLTGVDGVLAEGKNDLLKPLSSIQPDTLISLLRDA